MTTTSTRLPPMHASSAARNSLAARVDALPSSAGLWRFITLLALGGFFELYDLFETGYISTGLLSAGVFHTGTAGVLGFSDQAAFASATFLGLFFGASLLAPYADRFGRRLTFMCALLWYGLFSLLMAFQQSAEMIILFRFLVGIGLGVELVTIDTYLSEWVPSHLRSRVVIRRRIRCCPRWSSAVASRPGLLSRPMTRRRSCQNRSVSVRSARPLTVSAP
jgi:putative MFS transporter